MTYFSDRAQRRFAYLFYSHWSNGWHFYMSGLRLLENRSPKSYFSWVMLRARQRELGFTANDPEHLTKNAMKRSNSLKLPKRENVGCPGAASDPENLKFGGPKRT